MEAARRWATRPGTRSGGARDAGQAREGLIALGVPAEAAARMASVARRAAEPPFGVWPENWDALRVFLAMSTQWRIGGMAGVPAGLDYGALPMVLRFLRLKPDPDLFDRLQVMEGAALDAFIAEAQRERAQRRH